VKATCHFWCAPRTKNAEVEDIELTLYIPFIPQVGMDLKLTPDGECHLVSGVVWDVSEPDEVQVFLEEPVDLPSWEFMQAQGWKLA
jgi:hypothetical protein